MFTKEEHTLTKSSNLYKALISSNFQVRSTTLMFYATSLESFSAFVVFIRRPL